MPWMLISSFPQVLDENRSLIFAVLENQNLQRLAECSRYHPRTAPRLPTRVVHVRVVYVSCVHTVERCLF
jgi:hypothetical protein